MWGLFFSLLSWVGLSPVPLFADLIGTTEPALKLLLSIFMGYPLAIVYHQYVKQHKELRNLYFIVTGLDIAIYNFGISLYHNLIPTLGIYLTTMILGPGKINVIVTFVFNVAYLMAGYIWTESEDYDITWTMPHCVLTLKLIALSFDMWDYQRMKAGEQLSATNQKTAVEKPPTLVELLGFVYFPSCFLVGPQFSFKRYTDFVYGKFPLEQYAGLYEKESLKRLLQGILYLVAFQLGVSVFSMKYMQSDEFWERSIFYRHLYCGLWAHFALYKYISCWLLTEASCIRFGLSYNGVAPAPAGGAPTPRWDGCSNIKLLRFEFATKFQHYIDSFNCNTNHFAAEYIYKRLKFLGNRNASQFFTLLFLALWHGTGSGYYMTFFNEFIIIFMEKGLESILMKHEFYHTMWSNNIVQYVLYAVLKLYTIVFMGWSLVPFDLKSFSKWWNIYSSLYFSGFFLFLPWPFVYKPLLISGIKYFKLKVKTQ
ncbi:lysophospholipid acyltransferase 5 [Leguminivora glycinivorella]|uniref:lysophospholipid acyltransferase 5 n=1 Tax=Leguminivora glycinivorella TaxID=1035111 RepID=UPI002010748C|nr:lysophospholipid acyltransferase 5 [Leguminivora glycinivorella]